MQVLGVGDGYKYLPHSVTAADGYRSPSTPLKRYYVDEGSP